MLADEKDKLPEAELLGQMTFVRSTTVLGRAHHVLRAQYPYFRRT